ncbi:AMP-binding protein [Arenimonas soli]|uniref:AMP-binding protein n=1 Tax=Arenimonas soli TaxID=2269504 RepID=A0ABQ1HGR3_9GAMM|nr:AMP-binding protein [Arenimonas soli]GGA74668.1 AMP-binding protein [Arenimonas soli]
MSPDVRLPLACLCQPGRLPGEREIVPGLRAPDWLARVAAWRQALAAVPPGDVALFTEDAGEFSAALFGAWQAGRTPWLPGDMLPATLERLATQASLRLGDLPGALSADAPGDPATLTALDPASCRLVLYTSGSTGEPSAISKSLEQLDREVEALESAFGPRLGKAQVQGTVSHQHIYGLLFRVLWPLSSGRTFAPRRLAFNEQLTALGKTPVALVASPAHLKRLPANQDWSGLAGGLRAVFSSGGPLPPDAALEVRRLWGQAAIEVFGSTETGGVAWRAPGGEQAPWQALPGVRWRIEQGRLHLQSPHLGHDHWLATQDRAEASPLGGFVLLGRADRIVKIEERRVSLEAIEAALIDASWVTEARVVPLPGHRILLGAAIVPSHEGQALLDAEGRAALANRLRESLGGRVDPIAWPRRWRFLDALPIDARGKMPQRDLLALFRPHMPTPAWQERSAARVRLQLDVDPGLAVFDGHFPEAAILPGVALLDWANRLGRQAFAIEGGFEGMDAVKFQHLVRPGDRLDVELTWQAAKAQLGFRFSSETGVHASGRLRFRAEQGT